MKYVWTLGFALALWGAARDAGKTQNPKPKEPLAVVLSVSGKVQIVRAGGKKTEKAAPGVFLHAGDTVRAAKQSKATLIKADGKTVSVAAAQRLTLTPNRSSNAGGHSAARQLFMACLAKLRSFSGKAEKGAPLTPAVRGDEERKTLTLAHPRPFQDADGKPQQAFVRADAPTFTWTTAQGAPSYRFAILEGERPVVEKTLTEAEVKPLVMGRLVVFRPTDVALTPGRSYSWRVEARFAQGTKWSETQAFAVLAAEAATRIAAALSDANPGDARSAAHHVVRGAFLESNHLFADAIAEYLRAIAAEPKQPVYRYLLADLLDRSELYQLANAEYRAARDAAK